MASVTLVAYEVTIKKRRVEGDEVLSDFNNGLDFLDFFYESLTSWVYQGNQEVSIVNDTAANKLLRIRRDSLNIAGRLIKGIIETGEYGFEADIVNDRGEDVGKRRKNEAPMLPFYFVGYFPTNRVSGIFLIQKFKQFGAYGIFSKTIMREFREKFPEYLLKFSPLVSTELIRQFLDSGVIGKISFKKNFDNRIIASPSDRNTLVDPEDYYSEYNIVAKRNRRLNVAQRLIGYARGNDNLADFVAIEDYDFDEVKVNIKLGNNKRTINLSSLDNIGAFFDITPWVTFDQETGHPDFETVDQEASRILNDIIETTGLS